MFTHLHLICNVVTSSCLVLWWCFIPKETSRCKELRGLSWSQRSRYSTTSRLMSYVICLSLAHPHQASSQFSLVSLLSPQKRKRREKDDNDAVSLCSFDFKVKSSPSHLAHSSQSVMKVKLSLQKSNTFNLISLEDFYASASGTSGCTFDTIF